MASTKFINECKNGANSNRLGKVSVETIKKVSGTKLELSNTLDKKISPRLYGITKQNVYSGKQLFDVNDVSRTLYATTDKDGWITINVDNTNGTGWLYANYITNVSNDIKPNTEYALFFEIKKVSGTGSFIPNGYQDNAKSQFRPYYGIQFNGLKAGTYKKILTSIGEEETAVSMLRTLGAFNAGQSGSITFRISVLEDTTITTDNFVYEPFTGNQPSPSPDYPQEIEVATGSVSVKSTGKNLFNKNLYTYDYVTQNNTGNAPSYKDIPIYVGKANTNYFVSTNFLNEYTPYGKDSMYVLISNVATENKNWVAIGHTTTPPTNPEYYNKTIISDANGYLYLRVVTTLSKTLYEELMANVEVQIEEGTKTEYEPYKESSITYNLGDNFFADKDYIQDGVLNKKIGKVVVTNGRFYDGGTWKGYYVNIPNKLQKLNNYLVCDRAIFDKLAHKTENTVYENATNVMFVGNADDTLETLQQKFNGAIIYYELETPEQIQLETTGELRTFEPNTIITNSLDSEMEVEYSSWDTEITNSDNLTDVSIEDSCYVDGQIIGTTFEKKVTSQLIAVPNDVDLIDKKIKVEIGVKYDDLSNEMIKMGNYTIERPKDEQTENFTQITAYDDFNLLDNPYVCNLDFSNDITIADFYIDVCNQLKLSPMKTTFLNSDIKVTANPFVNKETLRVVLQEIEKVSCTFSEIDYETNKIDLVWLSENEEPDYEFATSDYTTLEGGKITYGPVNCLVIKESQIEGENTVRQDDDSIKTNGETQIAIQDSYFLFTQALREQAIDNIWNRVKGLTYVDCKLTTSYGKPFLKVGKKIRVNVNDGRVFDTYVLKHTFKYDGTFESIIESPALTKQETKVKSKSISESIRLTEIRVDKAEGKITATTKKTQEIMDNLNNNYYTIEQANTLIQNAETGVTNTFSEAGGNNEIRNSSLWFKNTAKDAEENPYEFWKGKANEGNNDKATNYRSILLGKGSFIHDDIEVPNGNYSISFYYRKLISNAVASVVINGKEYPLDSLETKQFYTGEQDSETGEYIVDPIVVSNNHIKIEFKCDALDGVEVYDLMCNKGTVKLAYSQNQNETTTDTVNISKGITITSSVDENTKFKADYDGIRVLDGNNNPKTTFTDKGTETDELVVRKKATITGLLHQEVDDQTWVTKI